MRSWEKIADGCTAPSGFRAAAVHAGIKSDPAMLDLALIYSDAEPTSAAGVFTTNRAAAAPVSVSRAHLRASGGYAQAVLANSGCANACTGKAGINTASDTARVVARALALRPERVLVASTGLIGAPLKSPLITRQVPALAKGLSVSGFPAASRAIMTTDTFPKVCALRTTMSGKPVHLMGMAKGAGMIHPHMATMLGFILTDAGLKPRELQRMLKDAVDVSFNQITVDGDTSTNDTVFALANGASGVMVWRRTPLGARFLAGLTELCQTLAHMIIQDGEGAKKFITVEVHGARREADADRVARSIANSLLVKTAIAGGSANWGRIVCAAGYSGVAFDAGRIDVHANGILLCRNGLDAGFDPAAAQAELEKPQIRLRVDLHQGRASAQIWSCDLSHDYININASLPT
jgi:glutamate N-acetyltransferase / amino-acid N-acetyltransferase